MVMRYLIGDDRTIKAIKKADKLPINLVKHQPDNKGGAGGNNVVSYANGNMYVCEIVEKKGLGIYDVKVYSAFPDKDDFTEQELCTYGLSLDDVYYPGQIIIAGAFYLDCEDVAPKQ